jgi:hypothetical protein
MVAGLGVWAQEVPGAGGARCRRDGALWDVKEKLFRLPSFDRVFLNFFQLKWTKWIIGKLWILHSSTTFVKGIGSFSPPFLHNLRAKITDLWAPMNSTWEH